MKKLTGHHDRRYFSIWILLGDSGLCHVDTRAFLTRGLSQTWFWNTIKEAQLLEGVGWQLAGVPSLLQAIIFSSYLFFCPWLVFPNAVLWLITLLPWFIKKTEINYLINLSYIFSSFSSLFSNCQSHKLVSFPQ